MWWVKALNANQLRAAMTKRIKSVMSVRRQGDRMGRGERATISRTGSGQARRGVLLEGAWHGRRRAHVYEQLQHNKPAAN